MKNSGLKIEKADKYLYIGQPFWTTFSRGSVFIDLGTVTNKRIDELLKADPQGWGKYFVPIKEAATGKKSEKTDMNK